MIFLAKKRKKATDFSIAFCKIIFEDIQN